MSLFLNQEQRPNLRNSITAFIDVLGFSSAVVSAEKLGRSQKCLDELVNALNDARGYVRQALGHLPEADHQYWALKFFSDNLLLGYPLDGEIRSEDAAAFLIRCIQHYELRMALSGFFVRGAISIGPLCITDDIIFGSALIESYQMESKSAMVPRVIVAEPIYQFVAEYARTHAAYPGHDNGADLLCHDIDGWWFVNYLHAAVTPDGLNWQLVERHRDSVMATLSHTARHDILPKFGWVSRYHNVFCYWHRNAAGYSDDFRIKRVDEESSIRRLTNF